MLNIIKKYKFIILILLMLSIGMGVVLSKQDDNDLSNETILNNDIKEEKEELQEVKYVYVDLKGAVKNPGVYKVEDNNRVIDVINVSGGLLNTADTKAINLSKKVIDEMTIIIYSKKEMEDAKKRINSNKEPTIIEIIKEVEKECNCPDPINDACIIKEENNTFTNEKININTATKEQLMTLPGIGESKANDIINYRSTTKFNTIDDIKNIKGIGESTFEKFKELITV